jgi:GT2 family glycosyltransferase
VKNTGFGGGVNFGADYAKKYRPNFLHVINTDTKIIDQNYISCLVKVLTENFEIALVGPAVRKANGDIQNTIMPFPTLKSIFFFKKHNIANSFISNPPQIIHCEVVNGVCFVVKANDFYAVDGFDEDYFMYVEEQDLSFKLSVNRKQSAFVSVESIVHYGADTFIKDVIDWKYVYNRKNIVLFLQKRSSYLSAFIISLFFSLSLLQKIIIKRHKVIFKTPLYILKQFFYPKTN